MLVVLREEEEVAEMREVGKRLRAISTGLIRAAECYLKPDIDVVIAFKVVDAHHAHLVLLAIQSASLLTHLV